MKNYKLIITLIFIVNLFGCSSSDQAFDRDRAAQARLKLGLAYLAHGDPQQAFQNLASAMQYVPENEHVQLGMAIFEQYINKPDLAEERYKYLLANHPGSGLLIVHYGSFLCANQRYQEAFVQFDQAIKLKEPKWIIDGLEQAAYCAVQQRDFTEADKRFKQLFQYEPQRRERTVIMSDFYKDKNNSEVADYLLSISKVKL